MLNYRKDIVIATTLFILGITTPLFIVSANHRGFGSMIGIEGINTIGTQNRQNDSLLHTIQSGINRVLGILAFITLCLVLYAGFLMLTSGGDSKKYDSGLKIIKNATIGLAIIAVSRLIVSLIFYVINGATKPNLV